VEIRRQLANGGGETPVGGVSQADFAALKASVIADLTGHQNSIMLMNQTLDNDAGVATTTFADTCDPPPITTA
jgi:hypothetical protein